MAQIQIVANNIGIKTIGYVIGIIARFIGALFLFKKDKPTA